MISSTTHITGINQQEKELEANVYVNRAGEIVRAYLTSPLFQGDKGVLTDEAPESGMSITPRLFGFCGGSHHLAATSALEDAWKIRVPAQAHILRAVAQAAEILQNASRWFYMTFAGDLLHPRFADSPLYPEVKARFERMKGSSFRAGAFAGKHPIALYALVGGQWPHASFLVPGGLRDHLPLDSLSRAFAVLEAYRTEWLETIWLGGSVERYLEVRSWEDLIVWMEEKDSHRNSDLGLFIRAALAYGLDQKGHGVDRYLSYGAFAIPTVGRVQQASPGGFYAEGAYHEFVPSVLAETLAASGLAHVHYNGKSAETGPLARMIMAGNPNIKDKSAANPLFANIQQLKGGTVFTRALARMHEVPRLFRMLQRWMTQLDLDAPCKTVVTDTNSEGSGIGLTEAPRGSLAHRIAFRDNRIIRYDILAPTLFNIASGDSDTTQNPLAEALKGERIHDLSLPSEVGMIARSFDACMVCTVNLFKNRSEKYIGTTRV